MASPQLENGYVKVANELMQALCKMQLRDSEYMVFLTVMTRTYGWHKKTDQISLSQFEKATLLTKPRIIRAIRNLVTRLILGSNTGNTRSASTYWVQKDYEKWIPKSSNTGGSTTGDTTLVTLSVTTPSNVCHIINKNNRKTVGMGETTRQPGPTKPIKTVFKTPTLADIATYCRSKNYTMDPEEFHAYWNSVNWIRKNGVRISNWKAAVDNRERNQVKWRNGEVVHTAPAASSVPWWENPEGRILEADR